MPFPTLIDAASRTMMADKPKKRWIKGAPPKAPENPVKVDAPKASKKKLSYKNSHHGD